MLRFRESESRFRVREADLRKPKSRTEENRKEQLAHARIKPKNTLQLSGFSPVGQPHEILGIKLDASVSEIKKAYRDLMKLYHPDRIGAPGSRQWQDAQAIAEAINHAKEQMLLHLKT